jgi:formylglycine-generating enzyme required for sulfatase activity
MASHRYHIFLSHNSSDKPAVEELAIRLRREGIEPWLDKWNLIPGQECQPAMERALADCATCAVFIGPGGLGPWQNEEMRAAIDRRVGERGDQFRVIPVLLPGTERPERGKLPPFLTATTWVEFRHSLDDEEAFRRLVCGIRGVEPGAGLSGAAFEGAYPYRGLEVFDVEHAPFFFGREALTEWLIVKLRASPSGQENRFLAILGASGSGKSSLARAGLIPAIKRGELVGSAEWPVVIFKPGRDPIESLAVELAGLDGVRPSPVAVQELMTELQANEITLHLTTRIALHKAPLARRLVLLVDQFEEVFTLCEDEKTRKALFANLLYAATITGGQTIVLLTMRADYYGKCASYPTLAAAMSDHQLLVGPMTEDELRRAIERPAQLAGGEFEPGLVEMLLQEVAGQPGSLPLLQFALMELWQRREGRRLTVAEYEALGRVAGAVGRRADAVFAGLTGEQQAAAPRLFGRLVRVTAAGEEGVDTRQRVRLGDLDEASRSAVEPFVAGRLLVTARDPGTSTAEANPDDGSAPAALDDPTTVEVVHEALIRRWERLRGWLQEDRAFLLWRQRLGFQIAEWERSGRDAGTLLRGALLKEVHRFARSRRNDLNERERKFLAQSESQSRRSDHEQRALALFKAIQTADLSEVPRLVNQLRPYRSFAGPWLARSLQESKDDSKEYLNSSLALLPVDAGQVEYLYNRLLNTNLVDLPVIREALKDHRGMIVERFWAVLENPQADSGQRFQAACALAHYDATGAGSKWDAVSRFISDRLLASVIENPSLYMPLIEMVRPVRDRLLTPLITTFHDKNEPGSKRALAASILADYASDKPEMLSDLLMDATSEQYAILFPKAQAQGQPVLASLESELAKKASPEAKDDEKDRLAQRQAKAAVALVRLGRPENVWPLLRHSPDPSVRSYIVNWLKLLGADPKALMAKPEVLDPGTSPTPSGGSSRMDDILFHPETSVRRALILALGEYQAEELSFGEREPLVVKLLRVYRHDPDSGIHGAAEWTLRRWNQEEKLKAVDSELKTTEDWGERRWYLNSEGQTLAVIEGPVEFSMGSPPTEPEHLDVETLHRMRINRRFAIATKEVTVMQYERFVRANQGNQRHKISGVKRFSPDLQGPQVSINWCDAAAYCNWLSQQEGLAACYEPNPEGEYAEGMKIVPDFLDRPGYRLPMEAEWEYACRAGAVTSRYYGGSVELLGKYAWYSQNSRLRAWPCGQLKPNDFGLFDLLGNAYEWCQDAVGLDTPDGDQGERDNINKFQFRIIRGGSFHYPPAFVRSAFRFRDLPLDRIINIGFRPARTYP